jgi:hypothetical protein
MALSRVLLSVLLISVASAAFFEKPQDALPGDMGYWLGIQEECDDFFCQSGRLAMFNYSIPPTAEHKGIFVVNITVSYEQDIAFFLERFNAYDSNTGRYFLISEIDGDNQFLYTFYTIYTWANPVYVDPPIAMNTANKLELSSMQYDTTTNTLFAVFDDSMYIINQKTGNVTLVGPLSTTLQIEVDYDTCYDSKAGNYFISILDLTAGYRRLMTYNTRTNSSTYTPDLNHNDYWQLYGFQYNPKNDTIIAYTYNPRGYPSLKVLNYHDGTHFDLIPEYIWGDYDYYYDLWPDSPTTNNICALDTKLNIFWMTVKYTDETMAEWECVVYYNLTKAPTDLMGSGPEPLYENALEFTNMVWHSY